MRNLIFLFSFLISQLCIAQRESGLTLGEVFSVLKKIDLKHENTHLSYEKYSDFDFSEYKPTGKNIDESDFFEIGYDDAGKICEISHYEKQNRLTNYKFDVIEFNEFRVLLVKLLVGKQFKFTPCAIIMMKSSQHNFMINIAAQFGTKDPYNSAIFYDSFPIKGIENISVVMSLDKMLYPEAILRISNKNIVMISSIFYIKSNLPVVEKEVVQFFFSSGFYTDRKIGEKSILSQLFFTEGQSDMSLTLYPNVHNYPIAPLWIFGGAHDYKK